MREKLQQLMKYEGLTSSRLADQLGIQPSGISHILSGRNKPGFDLLQKILRQFPHIDPDWLLLDGTKMLRDERTGTSGSAGNRSDGNPATSGAPSDRRDANTAGSFRREATRGDGREMPDQNIRGAAGNGRFDGHAHGDVHIRGTARNGAADSRRGSDGELFGGMFDTTRDEEVGAFVQEDRRGAGAHPGIANRGRTEPEYERGTGGAEGWQANDIRGQYASGGQPYDPQEVEYRQDEIQSAQGQRVERVILVYSDRSFEELEKRI